MLASCSKSVPQAARYSFDSAIDDVSTTYPIVKITTSPPDKYGQFDRCVAVNSLLNAIIIEKDISQSGSREETARAIAKSTPGHHFDFTNPDAIAALNDAFPSKRTAQKACDAINQGRPAQIGDYAPYLYVGDGWGGWIKVD